MVVSYWPTYTKGNLGAPALLGRDYVTFKRENRSFERVALIIPHGARLTKASEAATLPGAQVSADFFAVLGIKPAIGRTFASDEGTSTGAGVVVISNTLWRERFGVRQRGRRTNDRARRPAANDHRRHAGRIRLPKAARAGTGTRNHSVPGVRVLDGDRRRSRRDELPRTSNRPPS